MSIRDLICSSGNFSTVLQGEVSDNSWSKFVTSWTVNERPIWVGRNLKTFSTNDPKSPHDDLTCWETISDLEFQCIKIWFASGGKFRALPSNSASDFSWIEYFLSLSWHGQIILKILVTRSASNCFCSVFSPFQKISNVLRYIWFFWSLHLLEFEWISNYSDQRNFYLLDEAIHWYPKWWPAAEP